MIRKHIPKYSLIVISLLLALIIGGFASADVGPWIIDGDKVYVDDDKVYLSASPHTLSESGFVYFDINPKTYTGDVDLYFGFNSGGMKPTRAYYNNNGDWVNIASSFNKLNYDYDGFNRWYYSKYLPVQAGKNYTIAVWMEQPNEVSFGKYGFAIKPSSETITQAIANDHFYYLDPWWNSSWNAMSTITLNTSAPDNNFQIRLSSDDFTIPLKMWVNMNQDGNDTRILHADNITVFPIWIEHLTARDNYSIWVNVTDNTTADKLYWYYNNSNVSSASDGNATFQLFDDFLGSSFDAQWTSIDEDWSVSGGNAVHTLNSGSWDQLAAADILSDGVVVSKIKIINNGENDQLGVFVRSDGTYADLNVIQYISRVDDNDFHNLDYDVDKGQCPNAIAYDTWHYLKLVFNDVNIASSYSTDGSSFTDCQSYTTTHTTQDDIGFRAIQSTSYVDFVYVYKYADAEPKITDINLTVVVNTPPTKPTIITPTNKSYILHSGDVLLNVSSTDTDNDLITYYFYGDVVDGNTFIGVNDSINGTTFNWSISQYNVYYIKCQAYDGFNFSDMSDVIEFTLLKPPNLTTPYNTSTTYTTYPPLIDSVSFTWQDTNAPQYRLMIAEDINFNVLSVDIHVGTNNSNEELIVNKEYWWKVYSYDGTTHSNSSDVYSFNLAGNSTLTGSAIEGVVYQSNGDITAIQGAEVTIWNTTWSSSMITGSNGYYVFEDLNSGTVYNLQAKSDRYWDSSIALVSAEADPVTNNFYLIDDLTDTEWWHYVEFTVQNIWGVTYPDVATKVYIGDSPTISDSGDTESDGTITFHMDQNVQYSITFINATLGINEDITLYPVEKSYTVYIDSYSFDLPDAVTDDIQAYIVSSRITATHGYINFTWSDTSDLTTSINYYIHDVDGNELYNTSTSNSDLFDSQVVTATDDRYVVRYVGIHPTHGIVDKTETVVFHGGRRVDFGWAHDWQYAVTALAFLIFIGSMFGAKTAHYGAITVVMFAFIFKWIGWLDETNTSTLLIILAAVIAFGWSLRKSEEVKM